MTKEEEKLYWEKKRAENADYYEQIIKRHNSETQKFRMQSLEEKTERQWEFIIKTKYLMRNKWQEPNAQRVQIIKKTVLAWFQENKNEVWCDKNVYEKFLPPSTGGVRNGWQSVGEVACG